MTYNKEVTLLCKLFNKIFGKIPKTKVGIRRVNRIINSLLFRSFIGEM